MVSKNIENSTPFCKMILQKGVEGSDIWLPAQSVSTRSNWKQVN